MTCRNRGRNAVPTGIRSQWVLHSVWFRDQMHFDASATEPDRQAGSAMIIPSCPSCPSWCNGQSVRVRPTPGCGSRSCLLFAVDTQFLSPRRTRRTRRNSYGETRSDWGRATQKSFLGAPFLARLDWLGDPPGSWQECRSYRCQATTGFTFRVFPCAAVANDVFGVSARAVVGAMQALVQLRAQALELLGRLQRPVVGVGDVEHVLGT